MANQLKDDKKKYKIKINKGGSNKFKNNKKLLSLSFKHKHKCSSSKNDKRRKNVSNDKYVTSYENKY